MSLLLAEFFVEEPPPPPAVPSPLLSTTYHAASVLNVEIVRRADDYRLDFADGLFKAASWTTRQAVMDIDAITAGLFSIEPDTETWVDGFYLALIADPLTRPVRTLEVHVRAGVMTRMGMAETGRADVDKTGYALSSSGVQAIWSSLSSAMAMLGSIGKRLVDFITGDAFVRLGAPGVSLSADVASIKNDTGAAVAKTNGMTFSTPGLLDVNELAPSAIVYGAVVAEANSSTVFATTLTSADVDHFMDAFLVFLNGGGVTGQVKRVHAFAAGQVTLRDPLTRTPPAGSEFFLVTSLLADAFNPYRPFGVAELLGEGRTVATARSNPRARVTDLAESALAARASVRALGKVALTGASHLAVAAHATVRGRVTLVGVAEVTPRARIAQRAQATFVGTSTLDAAALTNNEDRAELVGDGLAVAAARAQQRARAALVGSSMVLATARGHARGATLLVGSDDLVARVRARGRIRATAIGASEVIASAVGHGRARMALVGSGALVAAGRGFAIGQAEVVGVALISLRARGVGRSAFTAQGVSEMAARGRVISSIEALLIGTSAELAVAISRVRGHVQHVGTGAVAGSARAAQRGHLDVIGSGALSLRARIDTRGHATLAALSDLMVRGRGAARPRVMLTAEGLLNGVAWRGVAARGAFIGDGSLIVAGQGHARGQGLLAGAGMIEARGRGQAIAGTVLIGTGRFEFAVLIEDELIVIGPAYPSTIVGVGGTIESELVAVGGV